MQEPVLAAIEDQLNKATDERKRYHFLQQIVNIAKDNKKDKRFAGLIEQTAEYFSQDYSEEYLPDLQAFKEHNLISAAGVLLLSIV